MKKVKLFTTSAGNSLLEDLEKRVNDWLTEKNSFIDVLDIKMTEADVNSSWSITIMVVYNG